MQEPPDLWQLGFIVLSLPRCICIFHCKYIKHACWLKYLFSPQELSFFIYFTDLHTLREISVLTRFSAASLCVLVNR